MYATVLSALAGASLFGGSMAAPASGSYSGSNPFAVQFTAGSGSSSAPSSGSLIPQSFPELNPSDLKQVEILAHGTEPNGPPGKPLSAQGIINLQFIEFNENFEVAFFNSFIQNVTNNVSGFEVNDSEKDAFVSILTTHFNQEILHAFNARSGLEGNKATVINPCNYKFPTATGEDALVLAKTFTDVVLGTLGDVINIFANNNDTGLPGAIASVVGQEGEQNGFYRVAEQEFLIPAALPFLTASTRDFAFSALNGFVDGQCDGSKSSQPQLNDSIANKPISRHPRQARPQALRCPQPAQLQHPAR